MGLKIEITNFKTVFAATPAELDIAVKAELDAGGSLHGSPFVWTLGICQVVLTKVLDTSPDQLDAIKAQAVAEALQAGTVIAPFDKVAADAQAVAEAIAAGEVVAVAKP